jgi:DHA2 family multidrug resistance protein-like MFS transporter
MGHPVAGRREWIGLALLGLPTLLLSLDVSVLYLALPHPVVVNEFAPASSANRDGDAIVPDS